MPKHVVEDLQGCVGKTIQSVGTEEYGESRVLIRFTDGTLCALVASSGYDGGDASIGGVYDCGNNVRPDELAGDDWARCMIEVGLLSEEKYLREKNEREEKNRLDQERREREQFERLRAKYEGKQP